MPTDYAGPALEPAPTYVPPGGGGGGGGGGAAADITYTPGGTVSATNVQTAIAEVASEKQVASATLTSLAALSTTAYGRSLLEAANAAAARVLLALGTGAVATVGTDSTQIPTTADVTALIAAISLAATAVSNTPAGNIAATTVQAAINELDSEKQPLNAQLSTIAALTQASFGQNLLTLANAAALRTAGGLGDSSTHPASDFQSANATLTSLAALTTTSIGRSLLEAADAAAERALLGLGTAAVLNQGTGALNLPNKTQVDSLIATAISGVGGRELFYVDFRSDADTAVDGSLPLPLGTKVLLTDQANPAQNGMWTAQGGSGSTAWIADGVDPLDGTHDRTLVYVGTASPSGARNTLYTVAAGALVAFGSGGDIQTVTYTTASLAQNAVESGSVAMSELYTLLAIQTSKIARVELYASTAHASADLARPFLTDPSGNHGVVLDTETDSTSLWPCTPAVVAANFEVPPTNVIPIKVTNLAVTTGTVAVTLTFIATGAPST